MLFYNLRAARLQWQRSLITIFIIAIAVGTFLTLSCANESFRAMLAVTAEPNNAVLVPAGGFAERWPEVSHVSPQTAGALRSLEDIAATPSGELLISPEVLASAMLEHRIKNVRVTIRGVGPRAFDVHQSVVGTVPVDGVLIGRNLRRLLEPIAVGDVFQALGRDWRVAGFFEPRGGQTHYDSEVWAPLEDMMHARNIHDYSFVGVRAPSTSAARKLAAVVNARTQPEFSDVRLVPELAVADTTQTVGVAFWVMYVILSTLVMLVAGLGVMNVLFQAVLRRRRHMALFRAMGFSVYELAGSFFLEGAAMALVGSILGVLMALPLGRTVFVIGSAARTGVTAVALDFTLSDMLTAVVAGTLLGAVCSLVPAWYAGRFQVKDELRAE